MVGRSAALAGDLRVRLTWRRVVAVTKSEPFSVSKRARSVEFAWRGVVAVARSQHNAWIHAWATVAAMAAGLYFRVGVAEWALLTVAMVAVWSGEAFNTAVEALGDAVSPEHHPLVGMAKDAAAGAVLVSSVGAVIIGALVFVPRIVPAVVNAW